MSLEGLFQQQLEDHSSVAHADRPAAGWEHGGRRYPREWACNHQSEVAIFPRDQPANSLDAFDGTLQGKLKFVRFRPPPLKDSAFPRIRLDRSLEFLLGGRFT